MKTQQKHMKKWRIEDGFRIVAGEGANEICIAEINGSLDSQEIDKKHARLIVRAVNSHDENEAFKRKILFLKSAISGALIAQGRESTLKLFDQAIQQVEGK